MTSPRPLPRPCRGRFPFPSGPRGRGRGAWGASARTALPFGFPVLCGQARSSRPDTASTAHRGTSLAPDAVSRFVGPRTTLVHGNHPARGEPARIAASGAVLVHCPGTHAYFDREPFPWSRYRRAGVSLALGTDSLASNDELDMFREMDMTAKLHKT